MKQPIEILRQWIECIDEEGRGVTDWERSFVESVSEQIDRSGTLTDKQIDQLEGIYARRTS